MAGRYPSWRPGVSVALITRYFRRHHGRLPIPREHHVEPEIGFVPVLSDGTASRLGILINGERESHVPDRLSKNLTLCAETTVHVIQRHDDGRTLPTGVLRTARATHAGGENASLQVGRPRCLPLQPWKNPAARGRDGSPFSARSRNMRPGLRASDMRAVKGSVSPKRQGHLWNRPLLFGVKSPSSVVLCTGASDTFCITWPTCASNNFRTVSKILFLPHNVALRRGTPLGQTLSDRLLATLRFRRATGECTVRQGTEASGSTGFALTVLDYN